MSGASTPRAIKIDDDLEVYRVDDDPDDDDQYAAPTKVGPMSKAFVDQLMFKAHIAESGPPSAQPHSIPPESGKRARAPSVEEISGLRARHDPDEIAVLSDDDEGLPYEPTVLSDMAIPPEARLSPSTPPARDDKERFEPLLPPAASPPPFASSPPPFASAPPPYSSPPPFSASPPPFSASPPPFASSPPPFASAPPTFAPSAPPVFPSLPAPSVEPFLSANAARWMTASLYPHQPDARPDARLRIEVAIVIGAVLLASLAAIVWLFP